MKGEGKFSSATYLNSVLRTFEQMPLAARIEKGVFCAHAGIGTAFAQCLNPQALIARRQLPTRVEFRDPLCELLWADPAEPLQVPLEKSERAERPETPERIEQIEKKRVLFDRAALEVFMKRTNVHLFVRTHQLPEEGFEYLWDHQLLTLFSASNFCGMNNVAAVAEFRAEFEYPKIFVRVHNSC